MKPYYSEAGITIWHGDCKQILPQIQADLVITDPPYGIGLTVKTSDYRDSQFFDSGESLRASVLYDDDPKTIEQLIQEVMPKILGVSGRAVIFPGQNMLWSYPKPAAIGCVFTMAGAGRCSWGFQCMHPVLFYGKDPFLQDGMGGRPNSLKDDQPNRERIDHPCPKPVAWMKWAIGRASRPNEAILDPFMGSGTTLVAAKDLGRRAVGVDIEERYCEIAANRLRQEVLQFS